MRPGTARSTSHPSAASACLDYANGQLGDWGIHWMDQTFTGPKSSGPRKSDRARYILRDHLTPRTRRSFILSSTRSRPSGNIACLPPTTPRSTTGCYFGGTEGTLHLGWLDGGPLSREQQKTPIHEEPKRTAGRAEHSRTLGRFPDSIKKGRCPPCDIETGHRSTTMSLLGMLSMKLGRSVAWDGQKETIPATPTPTSSAATTASRQYPGVGWDQRASSEQPTIARRRTQIERCGLKMRVRTPLYLPISMLVRVPLG